MFSVKIKRIIENAKEQNGEIGTSICKVKCSSGVTFIQGVSPKVPDVNKINLFLVKLQITLLHVGRRKYGTWMMSFGWLIFFFFFSSNSEIKL